MRRFLASLFVLADLFSVTAQAGVVINSYRFAPPPVLTFLQCASNTADLAVYSFTTQNTGTASPDRHTIIGVFGSDTAAVFGVDAVSVGGDAATEVVDEDGTGNVDTAIYIVANPLGTSETVALTFSETTSAAAICLWSVTSLSSMTAFSSTSSAQASAAAVVLDDNTTPFGVSVGICAGTSSPSATWIGLTERVDTPGGQISLTGADFAEDGTPSTPLTISCDYTGAANVSGAEAHFR